jgi:hypothetical protein
MSKIGSFFGQPFKQLKRLETTFCRTKTMPIPTAPPIKAKVYRSIPQLLTVIKAAIIVNVVVITLGGKPTSKASSSRSWKCAF